jgi:hypothetical protein
MPIFSWWPNIIVLFELTMLGTIVATVLATLVTTELPAMRSRIYDPEVSLGKIMVAVEKLEDSDVAKLERALRATGTVEVKRA